MGISDLGIRGSREFPPTSWSAIRHAQDPASPDYARHLERLVELYWRPVFWVIRWGWKKQPEDARDLTQDFFARVVFDQKIVSTYVPERGSFRALLRAALSHFMLNVQRDAHRDKRGGHLSFVTTSAMEDDGHELSSNAASPEELFDSAWTDLVLRRAVAETERRLRSEGKVSAAEIWRAYDLDEEGQSYAELGEKHSLTVPQVKHALIAAREAFREAVTGIVRTYVDGPEELAAEVRGLISGGKP